MNALFFFPVLLFLISCNRQGQKPHEATAPDAPSFIIDSIESNKPVAPSTSGSRIAYKVIDAPEGTYGYDIFIEGKVVIHQPNIPGMPGNKGFSTEEDAAKVAQLVTEKLNNNVMPPTVTEEELKRLGVVK